MTRAESRIKSAIAEGADTDLVQRECIGAEAVADGKGNRSVQRRYPRTQALRSVVTSTLQSQNSMSKAVIAFGEGNSRG